MDGEARVQPRQGEHQDEAGQHEAQPRKQAADATLGTDAEMDAQLVRLRPRQHLHDGQQLVESVAGNPPLVIDELAADHRDLRHGSAERHRSEAQEAQEQSRVAELRGLRITPIG